MPKPASKPVTLLEWINETGARQVAALLRVEVRNVNHWRRGVCLPRPEHMLAIKKYSRGAVTCDTMVSTFVKQKSN